MWSCSYDEVKRRCVQLSCNNSQILSFSPFLAFNKLPRPDNSAAEEGRSGWGRVPRSLRPFSAPFKQLNKYKYASYDQTRSLTAERAEGEGVNSIGKKRKTIFSRAVFWRRCD